MNGRFIGRTSELALLVDAVLSGEPGRVINVFGCAGIGKSQLLVKLVEELAARLAPTLRLTPGELESAVGDLRRSRGPVAEFARRLPAGGRAALLIDGYRPLPEVDAAVRTRLLPQLGPGIVTIIATRQPLVDLWSPDPAALELVDSLQLPPLSPTETHEYLRARGILDLAELDQIAAFAGGLPLALALAVDCVKDARNDYASALPGLEGVRPVSFHKAAQRIVWRLAEDVHGEELWSLIEAACVVRRSNEEVLSRLVGRAVSAPSLNQLCGWSGIRLTPEGLAVQPGIRQAVLETLRWRAPGRYAELRERAATWVADDGPEAVERVRLVGDPYIQSYLLTDSAERVLSCSGPTPSAPEVARACRGWLRTYLGQPEDSGGEIVDHLLALLRECPEGFVPVRDQHGTLLGFTGIFPVEPRLLPLYSGWAVPGRYLEEVADPLQPPRVFLYPAFVADGQDYEARGALIRACLERQVRSPLRVVCVTWVHDPMAARRAEQMLFSRVSSLTYLGYGADLPVSYYELDVTRFGPREWVERIMARLQGRAQTPPPTVDALRPAVATALHSYWHDERLERSPLAKLTPVQHRIRSAAGDGASSGTGATTPVVLAIRAALADALDELARGHGPGLFRHGAEEARALRLAYVDRLGSHERVMDRMGLPRTTYYRRLRAGLEHLAAVLVAWESLEARSSGR